MENAQITTKFECSSYSESGQTISGWHEYINTSTMLEHVDGVTIHKTVSDSVMLKVGQLG